MLSYFRLPEKDRKVVAEAADEALSDPELLQQILHQGDVLYSRIIQREEAALDSIEHGETLFSVGLQAYVRGSDMDDAFAGRPSWWPYVWQIKSEYGYANRSFSSLMKRDVFGDPYSDRGSFIWRGTESERAAFVYAPRMGQGLSCMIADITKDFVAHVRYDFKAGETVYRLDDFADCISAKDWDSIWLSHSAWCKDIWLLQTNSDCISSGPRLDIADLTLAEALDTFSRNRDVLEYRPLSWNPERDGLAGEDLEARNDMRNEEHER